MRKWTIGTTPVIALIAVVLFTAAACAQNIGGAKGKMGSLQGLDKIVKNPKVVEELGLTDAQVDKISELSKEASKKKIRIQADVQILQIDLLDLIEQDTPNTSAIDSIVDQIGAKNTESQKLMIHTLLDVKKVLTDEQIDKVKEFMAQRAGKQGNKSGKNGGNKGKRGQGGMMQTQPEDADTGQ